MQTYTFYEPFSLTSATLMNVKSEHDAPIGYIQKQYDKKIHRYYSLVMDKLFVHYVFVDHEQQKTVNDTK
ncbi:tubby C-terminal domain-like protein [Aureibacillus halotolerans]|uniref:Tubby C-terminal domain-containing protein n=1 Tax=Aureibacillus halotolerans TaxID=1508390 RepID=A0A4R6TPY2_9BACI|nr:hypothetical protein [Aureibacillus halotolerans]TDQ32153.1 hypothetical protein EV213_13316 [Aureibacillus halotolerans]